ncbi:MAG: pilus assembly protein TadG-related protein [Acidimicrobiales bacterium]
MQLIRSRSALHDERGSVLVIFAVSTFAFIFLTALALDIGNWFVHKRKLQNRVDAAALAAGVEYAFRFSNCDSTAAQAIADVAKKFAGDPTVTDPLNVAVNVQNNVMVRINANSPDDLVDNTDGADPCNPHPSADFGSPQPGTYWTDVKAVERDVASLFGGFGVPVPAITATARVAVQTADGVSGLRPFSAADPRLTDCVWVTWDTAPNTGGGLIGPNPLDRDISNPLRFTIDDESLPIGGDGATASIRMGKPVTAGNCSSGPQPLNGANAGTIEYEDIGFVAAYSDGGSLSVGQVNLTPGPGCAFGNPYFIGRRSPACPVGVSANITFPPLGPNQGREASAIIDGSLVPMCDDAAGGAPPCNGTSFQSQGDVTVDPGAGMASTAGRVDVSVRAQLINTSSGGIIDVDQEDVRITAGDDSQVGSIGNLALTPQVVNQGGANKIIDLEVELDPLGVGAGGDVPWVLRLTPQANDNILGGGFLCPSMPQEDAVRDGCDTTFTIDPGSGCPQGSIPPSVTWCLDIIASQVSQPVRDALNERWAPSGVCSANNWPATTGTPAVIAPGDPRRIVVPYTRVGARWQTNDHIPIAGFAGFYVTGWDDADSSCSGINEVEPPATVPTNGQSARVWGHYIDLALTSGGGVPNDAPCTPGGLGGTPIVCIASLVK